MVAKHAHTSPNRSWAQQSLPIFLLGFIFLLVTQIMVIAAGGNIAAAPHDQLDSTVEYYLLGQKHAGESFIPEMMGGLPSSYVEGTMLACRILYAIFPPATAFALQLAAVVLVGYTGMFLLLRTCHVRPMCCLAASITFGLLPFYSAYGLNVAGMPLVVYGVIRLIRNPTAKNLAVAVAICFLYASWSSIALGGYVACTTFFVLAIGCIIKGKEFRKAGLSIALLAIMLVVFYAITGLSIEERLANTLLQTSSRHERVLEAAPFSIREMANLFLHGQYHANSAHIFCLGLCICSLIAFAFLQTSAKIKLPESPTSFQTCQKLAKQILALIVLALGIAMFYSWFWSGWGIAVRNTLPGTLPSFQFDRIYWAYPTIWHVVFGLSCELLLQCRSFYLQTEHLVPWRKSTLTMFATCLVICCSFFLTLNYEQSYSYNVTARTISANYVKHRQNDPAYLSWNRFYAHDLFEQIEQDLPDDKSAYRVASIGFFPNIALYHGYYTLDGYLASYPLEYKHKFRQIIADELAASNELRTYFDEWGSRCYVFSHELGKNYLFNKTSDIKLNDLRLDLEKFKAMGGRYLICGVPIAHPEHYNLELVSSYSTDDSYYCIWVYEA